MSSTCAEHPHHLGVGVCASCVREKLLDCVRSLKQEAPLPSPGHGSYFSPNASDINYKSALSYSLQGNIGVSSACNISDENYTDSSFYSSHQHYVANHGNSSMSVLREKEGRPLSWTLVKVFKRGGIQRAKSARKTFGSSPASHIWDTPRPSTSKSPLKLASVSSPSPPSNHHSSQPAMSPLLLISTSHEPTIGSPVRLPPLRSSLASSRSPTSLPSPLRLRSGRPTIASHGSSRTHLALSTDEANRTSGHRISGMVRTKRKAIWLLFMLRKLRNFRFKHRFERQDKEVESVQADSNRNSSAADSDFYLHNQNNGYSCKQAHQYTHANSHSDLQISTFNRPLRDRKERTTNFTSCRDYGGWDSYYNSTSPVPSFNGLQARHRYKSTSGVQRRENTELLRFYLTPPSF